MYRRLDITVTDRGLLAETSYSLDGTHFRILGRLISAAFPMELVRRCTLDPDYTVHVHAAETRVEPSAEPCDDCQRSHGPHYTGCRH